jgi:hypothetical protein
MLETETRTAIDVGERTKVKDETADLGEGTSTDISNSLIGNFPCFIVLLRRSGPVTGTGKQSMGA